MYRFIRSSLAFLFLLGSLQVSAQVTLQDSLLPEFSDQLVSDNWPFLVGYVFDSQGRMFAFSKAGKIYLSNDGLKPQEAIIDISQEVANFGDHGLISVNLHPDFDENGYIYLLYTVDRHHLFHFGTPSYYGWKDEHLYPTIGRLTRYQLDKSTNFTTVVPESRTIMIGATKETGIPLLHNSHGLGSLVFGTDESLLISVGDGASYAGIDVGGDESGALAEQALREGIIDSIMDIGTFRAQSIHSVNGKILRIDPITGEGLPSNPYYDASDPIAARSRVWALGFRNPYRFRVAPNTGSHDINVGDPGVLIVSDVGWGSWEEWNRVEEAGQNFGWPLYEGIGLRWQYYYYRMPNTFAPNPSYGSGGCDEKYFAYNDLLANPIPQGEPAFPNPCQPFVQVPDSIPTFVHTPPFLTYNNSSFNLEDIGTYLPTFDEDGVLDRMRIDTAGSPVDGQQFDGICTVSGAWYTGANFPESYRGRLMMADYRGWIKALTFDTLTWELIAVEPFMERENGPARPISLAVNPADGCLWYIDYHGGGTMLRKICFGGNPPPRAVIEADRFYGPSPLEVSFDGSSSNDPKGDSLRYEWDFGDGETSTEINPVHTFTASGDAPQEFRVRLKVTDPEEASHEREAIVSLNNTPPNVRITSVEDGAVYTLGGITNLPLDAHVTDTEHAESELHYQWQVILHHNDHQHPEPIDTARSGHALVVPEGCTNETFWYRILLEVEDAAGLRGKDEVEIFPYCGTPANEFGALSVGFYDYLDNEIAWEMLQETPGSRYIIEQSPDKLFFSEVGEVSADGSMNYEFIENLHDTQQPYYRIKAISPDSLVEYSTVVQSEFLGKPDIWLYPNPARQSLYLEMEEVTDEAWIEIMDLQGRILSTARWEGSGTMMRFPLVIRDMSAGLYLYRASNGSKIRVGRFRKM